MLSELQMFLRFTGGMRRYFRRTLSAADCRAMIAESLRDREKNFLLLLERAVFGYAQSPYLALFQWAGITYGDVARMVLADGIEAAMERLFDAGVHVGLEEFKGRRPIERPGLSLPVTAEDFDNPLLAGDLVVGSGGSTGPRRRMKIDFDLLAHDAACAFHHYGAFDALDRPLAVWRGVPPDASGIKQALISAKLGKPMARWFSPMDPGLTRNPWQYSLITALTVHGSKLLGAEIPAPRFTPLDDPAQVARWLAEMARQGRPGVLSAAANNAIRACIAARDLGLDISGTLFRVSGEPFSSAKHEIVASLGCRTFSGWSMSEAGWLGGGCARREAVDEVHLFSGKIAAFTRRKQLADGESSIDALHLTTVIPSAPKLMLNLDTGDYGVLSRRSCGCLLDEAGFAYHLHTIRNYEKLTAGGIHFLGSEIVTLVEEILPAAFGGAPTDYQIVEEQQGALTQVFIVVSPRVGPLNEADVVEKTLGFLRARDLGNRLMSTFWQQGRTLQVLRREPHVTPGSKTPHLRVLQK